MRLRKSCIRKLDFPLLYTNARANLSLVFTIYANCTSVKSHISSQPEIDACVLRDAGNEANPDIIERAVKNVARNLHLLVIRTGNISVLIKICAYLLATSLQNVESKKNHRVIVWRMIYSLVQDAAVSGSSIFLGERNERDFSKTSRWNESRKRKFDQRRNRWVWTIDIEGNF